MSHKRTRNEVISEGSNDNTENSKKKRTDTAKSMDINVEKNEMGDHTQTNNKKKEASTVS